MFFHLSSPVNDGVSCATGVMMIGKHASVCRYGKDCAFALRGVFYRCRAYDGQTCYTTTGYRFSTWPASPPDHLSYSSFANRGVAVPVVLCCCDFGAAYCLFTSKVGPTDHFDWFMVYFVGLFTSSLVSYTDKLRSLLTSDMNSPVMHGAVPTQYELTRSRHQCA